MPASVSQPLKHEVVQQNALLRTLSQRAIEDLSAAELVRVKAPHAAYTIEQPIETVMFPLDAMFSVVTHLRDGSSIEVMTIGSEGMLPIPPLLGAKRVSLDYTCAVSGAAIAVPEARFQSLMRENPAFEQAARRFLLRYMRSLAQRVACNRLHTILQRGARWLLRAHDCGRDRIPLTHEHLAALLGSRRAGVSVALAKLQKTGCIIYGARYVTVVDRSRLEQAACECYAVLNQRFRDD